MIADKHKGHDIRFDQTTEEWICDQFGLTNKSLNALKTAVNRADKKNRTMEIPALYLKSYYWDEDKIEVLECTITLLRTDRRRAAATIKIGHDTEEVYLHTLYPMTERLKVEAYVAAKKRAQQAIADAKRLQDEATAFDAESLREAVVSKAEEAS